MQDTWADGYVSQINYTYGYYKELNPNFISLVFLQNGLKPPKIHTACELGFGQGLSINIHAAVNDTQWIGADFNPEQVLFAQNLNNLPENKLQLSDASFEQICNDNRIPELDFIALHGVWSWISDENRHHIINFINNKLKVGGVVYVSYNTMPGWASFAPVRNLLKNYLEVSSSYQSSISTNEKILNSIKFIEPLIQNSKFVSTTSSVKEQYIQMQQKSINYLAHEYFNSDWQPMYFSDVAKLLSTAKLSYACSADYLDNVDNINLTQDQQMLLADISDTNFYQSTRDFLVNKKFRKDYWVKGKSKISLFEQKNEMRNEKFVLNVAMNEITLSVNSDRGLVKLNKEFYERILKFFSDYKPHTLSELEAFLNRGNIIDEIVQAILILVSKGALTAASKDVTEVQINGANALNRKIIDNSRHNNDLNFLASPITQGGVYVSKFHQLFLIALAEGKKTPNELAEFVWGLLSEQGHSIIKNNEKLILPEENIKELESKAEYFNKHILPLLNSLNISY